MNKLEWLSEKEIAILTDWEVVQIIKERGRTSGMFENVTEFLCLLRRVK